MAQFRRNAGKFKEIIEIQKPSARTRDEQGGWKDVEYSTFLRCFAMITQTSQVNRDVVGDYVTAQTLYFTVRDFERGACASITNDMRIKYNNIIYNVNEVRKTIDTNPCYYEIIATAISRKAQ